LDQHQVWEEATNKFRLLVFLLSNTAGAALDQIPALCYMSRFVGRQHELDELNQVQAQGGAQFLLVYGRRRVGKTTLILRWAQRTGRPVIYWVATRDTPAQVRFGFTQALWAWAYPGSQAVPRFDTWSEVFETAAQLIGDQPVILIMDEFSYAAESDSALPSNLQAAWDHLFKDRNATIVLAGSHIGMMVELMGYLPRLGSGQTRGVLAGDLPPAGGGCIPFIGDAVGHQRHHRRVHRRHLPDRFHRG
jgi:hypothetical protein